MTMQCQGEEWALKAFASYKELSAGTRRLKRYPAAIMLVDLLSEVPRWRHSVSTSLSLERDRPRQRWHIPVDRPDGPWRSLTLVHMAELARFAAVIPRRCW